MRIAVLGAGAVGGYYGGRLAQGGEDVHFLYHTEFEAVRERGLRLESVDGNWHGPVAAYADARDMPVCDLAILGFKSAQAPLLASLLPPVLGASGVALCLMNGLGNEETLEAILGPDRVLAGAAFICAERGEPGVVKHFAVGGLSVGPYFEPGREALLARATDLAERFAKVGVRCRVESDGRRVKWGKLVWNVPFSGLSLHYGGVTTDRIVGVPERRAFARALMDDILAAARADGVEIDPKAAEHNLSQTDSMGAYRPSMLVDWELGRPVEWEAIVREPWLRARRAGIPTPALDELVASLESICAK